MLEQPSKFFNNCEPLDEDEVVNGMDVGLLIVSEENPGDLLLKEIIDAAIVLEEQIVLYDLKDVSQGSDHLMGLLYVLNISCTKELKYTFEVVQKVIMKIGGDTCSSRVHAVRKKLLLKNHMDHDRVLRTKLDQLECHFTWALRKDDIDFNKLNEKLKLHLEQKEDLTHTYNALAYVKFLQGVQEEALSNLMTSLKLYKECHDEEFHKSLIVTYGNLAWINYHMKNYTECESYLQKVQKINENISSESSSVPEVLGEKGWTFRRFSYKYHEKSKECFKKALDLEPEVGKWNASYAIALYRTEYGEYGEFTIENSPVIKQLRRAIETNPDDDVLKIYLALQLGIYKSYEEGERWVAKALESSPDHPRVLTYAGKFFFKKGCVDRGIVLLRNALELSPYSALTHHQLALGYKQKKIQLLQEGNHYARASEVQQIRDKIIYHLEIATKHATGFITAMSELALHYGEQHDISRAEEMFQVTFETAKEKNDKLHVVHFHYAEFQFYCKRDEVLAIKHYMECLKMNPGSHEGKRSVYKLKMIAEKRINKNTQVGKAYGILGFIHKEKGEKRRAIECYEKALSYGENDEYLTNLCALRLSI